MATAGLSSQEITDRQQIQAVWIRYWDLAGSLFHTATAERAGLVRPVAVPTQADGLLAAVADFEKKGLENYGTMGHRLHWVTSVGGKTTAMMSDCLDESKAARAVTKTGQSLSVGPNRLSARGLFMLGADKVWRVSGIQFLPDQPC